MRPTDSEGPIAWITGAGGLIGNYISQIGGTYQYTFRIRPITRQDFDLLDFAGMEAAFKRERPSLVIHCAALSKSPVCEANPELARQINVKATGTLADLARDIPFVFFSSDLVFDGNVGKYDESARVNPLNVYAETKAAAERLVLRNPNHTVIRTSLNGGNSPTGDRGFNEEIRRAWREGKTLRLFTDEFRSPIPASATARAVWELIAAKQPGIYHIAGSERLSRWEIGEVLAQRSSGIPSKMEPSSRKDYSGPARPPDTSLNCSKIQRLLSFPLPGLRSWLGSHPEEPF